MRTLYGIQWVVKRTWRGPSDSAERQPDFEDPKQDGDPKLRLHVADQCRQPSRAGRSSGSMNQGAATRHLASWVGEMPRQRPLGRQAALRPNPQGSKWLDWTLKETAQPRSAPRTSTPAQYQRLRPRRGHRKPSVPSSTRSPSRLAHALDRRAIPQARCNFSRQRDPKRITKLLVAQLEELGTMSPWRRWRPEGYFLSGEAGEAANVG
jgi:hypothetical protein